MGFTVAQLWRSAFPSAPDSEQRGDFQFAAEIDGARGSAIAGEQPTGSGGVGSIQRITLSRGLSSGDANSHNVRVSLGLNQHATAGYGVPLGGSKCHQYGVRKTLRFGPNGIDVGVDLHVALEIAQFAMMGVHFDRSRTHIVNSHRFGISAEAFRKLAQLLQHRVQAVGFRSQRLDRLFYRNVALFQQVGRRRNRRNTIAQRMCYAA